MSMQRIELESAVNRALDNDGVVDSQEIRGIVRQALEDGIIDPSELVIARNALQAQRRAVGDAVFNLNEAEGAVDASKGTARHPMELARRDLAQSDLTRARNRLDALQRIDTIFHRHADGAARVFGGIGNVFGDIFRGGRDVIDDIIH
jgi:hypothetical protein